MSEGHQSAKRFLRLPVHDSMTPDTLNLHRVDSSQLQTPVHVQNGRIEEHEDDTDDEGLLTLPSLCFFVLLGLASWGVVGVAFYSAFKLVEAMR